MFPVKVLGEDRKDFKFLHKIILAYDYSRADSDGLLDHLRDVPWEDIGYL